MTWSIPPLGPQSLPPSVSEPLGGTRPADSLVLHPEGIVSLRRKATNNNYIHRRFPKGIIGRSPTKRKKVDYSLLLYWILVTCIHCGLTALRIRCFGHVWFLASRTSAKYRCSISRLKQGRWVAANGGQWGLFTPSSVPPHLTGA